MSGAFTADAVVVTQQLTVAQTLALYGESISCVYYNGIAYETASFDYVGAVAGSDLFNGQIYITDTYGIYPNYSTVSGYEYLVYTCPESISNSTESEFSLWLTPSVSLSGLNQVIESVLVPYYGDSMTYDWHGSSTFKTSSSNTVDMEQYWSSGYERRYLSRIDTKESVTFSDSSVLRFYDSLSRRLTVFPVYYYDDANTFGFSDYTVNVRYIHSGGIFYPWNTSTSDSSRVGNVIFVQCPILSDGFSSGGTGGTGSESDSGGVKDIVDALDSLASQQAQNLSESGPLSWLGSKISAIGDAISNAVDSLVEKIKNLFIPSEDALEGFTDTMEEEFTEHLGGISEGIGFISALSDMIKDAATEKWESIKFPGIKVPVPLDPAHPSNLTEYEFAPSDTIALRPYNTQDRLKPLWDTLAYAIDIVCICAFLNMLKTKRDILLSPEAEVITYDN